LPVPGPARTNTGPSRWSTTCCCPGSSSGAPWSGIGAVCKVHSTPHTYHAALTWHVWHHQQVASETVIIEGGVAPRRIRRPADLVRFLIGVLVTVATVFLGWLATSTTAGLDSDISAGASLLPGFVVLALNIVAGLGIFGLPIAITVGLLIRRRPRQLFDAFVGLLIAILLLTAASTLVTEIGSPRLLIALAGSVNPNSASTAPILGGLIAFITVARVMSRRPWNVLAVVVIASLVTVTLVSSGIAPAGIIISLTTGWAVGTLTRYVLGTPASRPSGYEIAQALGNAGFPIIELRALESTSKGRRYLARTRSNDVLQVTVLDRDMEGSGLLYAAWTAIRLRDDPGTGAFNMRRALDHAALLSYAGEAAGAPQPRLLVTSEVGPGFLPAGIPVRRGGSVFRGNGDHRFRPRPILASIADLARTSDQSPIPVRRASPAG
jgi:hypothetical protein